MSRIISETIEIEIDRAKCLFPDYVYSKPIRQAIKINPYEGKSLEEIRNQYGNRIAQYVYDCACRGKDITKLQPIQDHDMVKSMIKLRMIFYSDRFSIYIVNVNKSKPILTKKIFEITDNNSSNYEYGFRTHMIKSVINKIQLKS